MLLESRIKLMQKRSSRLVTGARFLQLHRADLNQKYFYIEILCIWSQFSKVFADFKKCQKLFLSAFHAIKFSKEISF